MQQLHGAMDPEARADYVSFKTGSLQKSFSRKLGFG